MKINIEYSWTQYIIILVSLSIIIFWMVVIFYGINYLASVLFLPLRRLNS